MKHYYRIVTVLVAFLKLYGEGNHYDFMINNTVNQNLWGLRVQVFKGNIKSAFNNEGKCVPLLQQNGPVRADYLGVCISGCGGFIPRATGISEEDYNILKAIANTSVSDHGTYGQLLYDGKMSYLETYFSIAIPLTEKWSVSAFMPFYKYKFDNHGYSDLSPDSGNGGFNKSNADWIAFLKRYQNILEGYGFSTKNYVQNALGDLQLMVHVKDILSCKRWSLSGGMGLNLPTGKERDYKNVFEIDYGYQKHIGIKTTFFLWKL